MADQTSTTEKKVSKLSKLKQKYQNSEVKIEEFKQPLPPFDEKGNKQGNWLEESYQFSTWYYDLDNNPVYISQQDENDNVGILYDENNNEYFSFSDSFGNPMPVVLRNEYFFYFTYIFPIIEIQLPQAVIKNTTSTPVASSDSGVIKKAATDNSVASKKSKVAAAPTAAPKQYKRLEKE